MPWRGSITRKSDSHAISVQSHDYLLSRCSRSPTVKPWLLRQFKSCSRLHRATNICQYVIRLTGCLRRLSQLQQSKLSRATIRHCFKLKHGTMGEPLRYMKGIKGMRTVIVSPRIRSLGHVIRLERGAGHHLRLRVRERYLSRSGR